LLLSLNTISGVKRRPVIDEKRATEEEKGATEEEKGATEEDRVSR
jgi:hypothetical protein